MHLVHVCASRQVIKLRKVHHGWQQCHSTCITVTGIVIGMFLDKQFCDQFETQLECFHSQNSVKIGEKR